MLLFLPLRLLKKKQNLLIFVNQVNIRVLIQSTIKTIKYKCLDIINIIPFFLAENHFVNKICTTSRLNI